MQGLAYYLSVGTLTDEEVGLYREAELALNACIAHSRAEPPLGDDQERVAQVLSLHDAQLAIVPAHRYIRAWEQMQSFLKTGGDSPVVG